MTPLPIDEVLGQFRRESTAHHNLVVLAPAGAGKTTRIPQTLLSECSGPETIVVTEPRRVAARLAATRIAEQRGEKVGGRVGYRVRFDDRTSESTRLFFETDGLFLRRVLGGADLTTISTIFIDEIHERNQTQDALLAVLLAKQKSLPHLRIVVMSATLEANALRDYLGDAHLVESQGRSYPVDILYEDKPDDRPLPLRIVSAVKRRLQAQGDILVFLPSAAAIRRAREALSQFSELEILALHGDMPLSDQTRIIAGGSRAKRVILATNVAESSITIPGITTVIDSGLARVSRHDPLSGAPRLAIEEISQARLDQRAGRAGRTAKGVCLRLFSKGSYQRRPRQDTPELLRTDLSELRLLLASGGASPNDLEWLSPPKDSAWKSAEQLLESLDALDSTGTITPLGSQMAGLPLPPRLARVVVEGHRRGLAAQACRAAAIVSEKELTQRTSLQANDFSARETTYAGDSDLDDRLALLEQQPRKGFDPKRLQAEGIDHRTARRVSRVAEQLEKQVRSSQLTAQTTTDQDPHEKWARCLFSGFPDRVATRRGRGRKLVMSNGAQAELSTTSCVQNASLLLAVAASARREHVSEPLVDIAVRLDPDWLFSWAPDNIIARETATYDAERDRVVLIDQLSYGKVVLDETIAAASPGPVARDPLLSAAVHKGPSVFDPRGNLETLAVRLRLLSEHPHAFGEHLTEADAHLFQIASSSRDFEEYALRPACLNATSLSELAKTDLAETLVAHLDPKLVQLLERELPPSLRLPSGKVLRINYEWGKPPYARSRLQDFFSMTETPRLLFGTTPLQLHLLAPNQRAIQVTTDLAGFWERHYPELRRQLMRRYPKHSFPEDGRRATPPPPGRLR